MVCRIAHLFIMKLGVAYAVKGGKWTDGGAAQQERQDTKAVIRRRTGSYVQIDAQGEELPFAAYEMKRSDALHCADCRTHL